MAEIDHFSYGFITPVLAYGLSVFGSLLGLTCTVLARSAPTARRKVWFLLLAAWAIGGTGIWVMHFIAMLGFGVPGTDIRYDVPITAASALIAVAAVALGLCLAGLGRPHPLKFGLGGLFTGLGVAAMHYTGMAAMRLEGLIRYDQQLVLASVAVAVVAATAALWFAVTVRRTAAIIAAALVMGVAVTGMHYTGMYAMQVHLHGPGEVTQTPTGSTAFGLLIPIMVLVVLAVIGLVYALLAAPTGEDRAAAAYLERRAVTAGPAADGGPPARALSAGPAPTTRRQSIPRAARRGR